MTATCPCTLTSAPVIYFHLNQKACKSQPKYGKCTGILPYTVCLQCCTLRCTAQLFYHQGPFYISFCPFHSEWLCLSHWRQMVSLQLSVAAQTISLHQAFFLTWAFSPKGPQLVKKHVATLLELHEVQAAGSSGSWHKHTLQYFWKWCVLLKPTRHGHSDGMHND